MSIYKKVEGKLKEFASKVSVSQTVTTSGAELTKITVNGGEEIKIAGSVANEGEILYPKNDGSIIKQTILDRSLVVNDLVDLDLCKSATPNYKEIFDRYKLFSLGNYFTKTYSNRVHKDYSQFTTNPSLSSIYSDLSNYVYESDIDRIVQHKNSYHANGLITPETYSDYDITIRCYSYKDDTDDGDQIGLVAAYAEDENGIGHYLTFSRTAPYSNGSLANFSGNFHGYTSKENLNALVPTFSKITSSETRYPYLTDVNSGGVQWTCRLNTYHNSGQISEANKQLLTARNNSYSVSDKKSRLLYTILADGSGTLRFDNEATDLSIGYDATKQGQFNVDPSLTSNNFADYTRPRYYTWGNLGKGFLVRVKREGNKFTAWTSELEQLDIDKDPSTNNDYNNDLTLADYTKIEVDLDALIADDRVSEDMKKELRLFLGKSSFGYFNASSPGACFQNIDVSLPENTIVNMLDRTVLKKINGAWVEQDITPSEQVGKGRFSYNYLTNKLFFSSQADDDIYQIGG